MMWRLACLVGALATASSVAHAEFRGKGSIVGRILSESVAGAESPTEDAGDDIEEEKPISRDALNALMKHPTIPNYDPLRPLSGKWIRCRANSAANKADAPYVLDRFSSTDRSRFTHTQLNATDGECKTTTSGERTAYECTAADKKEMFCKVTRREAKTGSGTWLPVKLTGSEKSMTIGFPGQPGKKSKKRAAKAQDPRKLEARINGEAVMLDYEPSATPTPPATPTPAHKTND